MLATMLVWMLSNPSRPPTLDPTYGFPTPTAHQTATKLPPDADWIWTRETKDNQTVYFRQSFRLARKPSAASLYITADNAYDVYVNGQELGQTKVGSDGDMGWAQVHRYDVPNLAPGQNSIAVVAFNQSGPAGLLSRLVADNKPIVLSDWTWRESETEPPPDWKSADYSDAGWTGALKIQTVGGDPWGSQLKGWPVPVTVAAPYLYHLSIKAVKVAELQAPGNKDNLVWRDTTGSLQLQQPTPGQPWGVVVDFGEELTGRIRLDARAPAQVQVGTGESPSEAVVRPWTSNTLDLVPGAPSYTIYTALRDAALVFPASQTQADLDVSMDHLYYPVQYKGSFDSSDPVLNKIWYTGAYTAHSCMQEDIWDAPKRDRMRWMGDLHVSGEVINNVFLDRFLMEQTLSRLRKDAQGGKPDNELPNDHVNGIPGYSCAWIAGLTDFYKHTGDIDYLKKQHDALISMMEYFRGELDDQGLFANKRNKWPFVDWSPDFDKLTDETKATTHLFLTLAVKDGAYLLGEMGDQSAAAKYAQWADSLADTARKLLPAADGTYGGRRQENAMAIYSGVATPEQTAAIWDNVLNLQSPSWKMIATPYYNNYVIFAMSLAGHTKEALAFVRDYWGGMLDEGATTFWEGYDVNWQKDKIGGDDAWIKYDFHQYLQADDGTGYFVSLCHGWSAGATNFLTERILGVRSTGPGFKTCEIRPDLCGLEWASGAVPTPHGLIKVKVSQDHEKVRISLDLPPGVHATVGSAAGGSGVPASSGHAEIVIDHSPGE